MQERKVENTRATEDQYCSHVCLLKLQYGQQLVGLACMERFGGDYFLASWSQFLATQSDNKTPGGS